MDDKWKMFFLLMFLVAVTVWLAVLLFPEKEFKVIACNVGQGDAILITYGSTQILTDGGPDTSVLSCLSEHMAFWDRDIELMIMSHPQTDHFEGFIDIFRRYNVKTLMTSGLSSSSQEFEVLETVVGGSDTEIIKVEGGQEYRLGLIYLDILWPTETFILANSEDNNADKDDVLGTISSNEDANEFSIVSMISFNDFEILLTGDISPKVSDILVEKIDDSRYSDIEVLKVPHHGSKNGMTEKFLTVIDPEIAIISVGENSYGHPHKEVLDLLTKYNVEILRTDKMGDVVVVQDMEAYWVIRGKQKPEIIKF